YVRPEGIVSYLLASPRTCGAVHLAASLVEIQPGGAQRVHAHDPEQLYFILEGSGRMTVGTEAAQVKAGDCVFIPSGALHGLTNDGPTMLTYFSAAAPAFTSEELAQFWPLPSEVESKRD